MNSAANNTKNIAAYLRNSWAKLDAKAYRDTVRVSRVGCRSHFVISDLLPPGWGVQEAKGFDRYVVRWVG
jgi:hypothetical protein